MRRMLCALQLAALALVWAAMPVSAQVADHLKCYKIKDSIAKTKYTADLGASLGLPADSGCVVKMPGKLLCIDSTKTNVNPAPPGANAGPQAGRFVCYNVKCPKQTLAAVPWNDQFGTRTIEPKTVEMLCAPEPAAGPPCVTGGCAVCGSCGDGRCHLGGGGGGCGTLDNTPQCVSASTCQSSMCNSHADCGSGQVCVVSGNPPVFGSLCCEPCP